MIVNQKNIIFNCPLDNYAFKIKIKNKDAINSKLRKYQDIKNLRHFYSFLTVYIIFNAKKFEITPVFIHICIF
jgi:hypothetical protein